MYGLTTTANSIALCDISWACYFLWQDNGNKISCSEKPLLVFLSFHRDFSWYYFGNSPINILSELRQYQMIKYRRLLNDDSQTQQ